MATKETPLFKATDKPGALPGFLFANPLFAGFFAMIMAAVFGAVLMMFLALGHGGGYWVTLFDSARIGAVFAMLIGFIVLVVMTFRARRSYEDRRVRLLFVLGGYLGLASLIACDLILLERLRPWLETLGPITATSTIN